MRDKVIGLSSRGLETRFLCFLFYIGIVSWILSHTYLMNKSHGKIGWLNSEGLCFMRSEGCGPVNFSAFMNLPTWHRTPGT